MWGVEGVRAGGMVEGGAALKCGLPTCDKCRKQKSKLPASGAVEARQSPLWLYTHAHVKVRWTPPKP